MTLDLRLPISTRDGRMVMLIGKCPVPHDGYPLAVAVRGRDGEWSVETYREDGRFFTDRECGWDLVNTSPAETAKRIKDAARPQLRVVNDCQGEKV